MPGALPLSSLLAGIGTSDNCTNLLGEPAFDRVRALFPSQIKGWKRVLGSFSRGAPVRDNERACLAVRGDEEKGGEYGGDGIHRWRPEMSGAGVAKRFPAIASWCNIRLHRLRS